jgi:biopolymer transport protein ExbD/biopolymer transport protein TolR
MRLRRRGDRMAVNAEINVVSLIDVMMLLMVIFMITAPMMQGGVDVALPRAAARPIEAERGVIVSIQRNGRLFVDDAQVSLAELAGSIQRLAERNGRRGVYLRADAGVPYGTVVQVLATMRKNGVTDVGLVAEPEDERSR